MNKEILEVVNSVSMEKGVDKEIIFIENKFSWQLVAEHARLRPEHHVPGEVAAGQLGRLAVALLQQLLMALH